MALHHALLFVPSSSRLRKNKDLQPENFVTVGFLRTPSLTQPYHVSVDLQDIPVGSPCGWARRNRKLAGARLKVQAALILCLAGPKDAAVHKFERSDMSKRAVPMAGLLPRGVVDDHFCSEWHPLWMPLEQK